MATQDPTPKNPISQKVYGAAGGGGPLGLLTWALTTYIPAWHNGIPQSLQGLLPYVVGILGAVGGGYASTHVATVKEIQAAFQNAQAIEALVLPTPQAQPAAFGSPGIPTIFAGGGGVGTGSPNQVVGPSGSVTVSAPQPNPTVIHE